MDWDDIDGSILERRAAELARPRSDDDVEEKTTLLLEFRMLGASYAVELKKVEAVSRIGDIFTIPLTPKHIPGIIRRRGESIAIVNLRHFFHPESEGLIDTDFAVIVSARGKRFALQVEEIEGVFHTPQDSLKPPPDNFDKAQAQYLSGVTLDGLAVLNLEKLVDADGFGTMVKRGV